MLLSERLAEVYDGPSGPEVAAFFDFDGTVIHGYSAVDFYLDRIRSGKVGPLEAIRTTALALRGVATEEDFERLVAVGLSGLDGHHQDDVSAVGERLFAKRLAGRVYPEAWQLVEAHRRMGHTVVMASSATRFQVEPAARTLGIEHVLGTALEVGEDGILTGRADGPPLWRAGKAAAVRQFAADHDIALAASYAYSNGNEDVDFLSQVGHPRGHHPGGRAARARHRARVAGARLPQPGPALAAHHRQVRGRDGRHPDRHRHRGGVRVAQRQPPYGDLVDHGALVGVLPRRSPACTSRPSASSTCGSSGRRCSCSTTRASSTCS